MKQFVAILMFVVCCYALPPPYKRPIQAPYNTADHGSPQQATILQQDYVQQPLGPYSFSYQTSDGVKREEKAEVRNPGQENEYLVVQGSYSYIGQDGETYVITYEADENGYRASGPHIPKIKS